MTPSPEIHRLAQSLFAAFPDLTFEKDATNVRIQVGSLQITVQCVGTLNEAIGLEAISPQVKNMLSTDMDSIRPRLARLKLTHLKPGEMDEATQSELGDLLPIMATYLNYHPEDTTTKNQYDVLKYYYKAHMDFVLNKEVMRRVKAMEARYTLLTTPVESLDKGQRSWLRFAVDLMQQALTKITTLNKAPLQAEYERLKKMLDEITAIRNAAPRRGKTKQLTP